MKFPALNSALSVAIALFLSACGGGGGSSSSSPKSPGNTGLIVDPNTPTTDIQAPSTPSSLRIAASTSRSLTLSWSPSSDNTGVSAYDVLRDGSVVGSTSAGTESFTDTALSANTSYAYTVRARDAAGNTSGVSPALGATTSIWPVLQGDPGVSALRSASSASAFYIDANNGNDSNNGRSPATAWRTLDRLHSQVLGPGDVVRLARNSVWKNQNLFLDEGSSAVGSSASPIIIEAYGAGAPPTISEPRALWDKTKEFAGIYIGSQGKYITILDLRVQDTTGSSGVTIHPKSEGIIIAGLEVLRCGTGISVAGKNQKILSCYIHDINRSNSGIGIGFLGSDLKFAWNRLAYCVTTRSDNVRDGSPFEYYGRSYDSNGVETFDLSDNIQIHHNLVDGCLNFIETYGNATRLVIAFNLYVNSPPNPLVIHFDDCEHSTWTHECTYEMTVENNTFVPAVESNPGGWGAFGLLVDWNHLPDATKSHVTIRNNVLVTNYTALSWLNPLGANLVHDHNLFLFLDHGKLCTNSGVWTQDATEIIADPLFVDGPRQDFRLKAGSPAIGKGAPALYSSDLAGLAVSTSTATDIGAFQHSP